MSDTSTTHGGGMVWDGWTRFSHWALVLLFAWQFLSGHFGWLPGLHLWGGYLLLAVLLFRLQWGLFGSASSRFTGMLRRLGELGEGLRTLGRRRPGRWRGHNPLGVVSVLLMLGLLLAQSATGLFVETWGDVRGPLAERIGRDAALAMADLHDLLRWPLLLIVVVHIAAAVYHRWWKKDDRIAAIFLHGRLEGAGATRKAPPAAGPAAAIIALAAVGLIAWLGPIG